MNKTCRFNSTYNRNRCTYSASFKDLSKLQLTILRTIFRTLCYDGVIIVSDKGFSVPYVSLSCCSPLLSAGDSMTVPFAELSSLAALFGCKDLPTKDISVHLKV